MRTLHVIRPAEGGMKGNLLGLAKGLAEKAFEVEAACPRQMCQELEGWGFTRVHPLDIQGSGPAVRDALAVFQLASVISGGGFDIVHLHGFKAAVVGMNAAALAGFRNVVITVHSELPSLNGSTARRLLYWSASRLAAAEAAAVVTVSDSLRREVAAWPMVGSGKVTSIRNGIDLERFSKRVDRTKARESLGLPPESFVAGTVSRLVPQKGIDVLLRCAARLIPEEPLRLVIAGDGPSRGELTRLAEKLGVGERVLFTGFVEDVPRLLKAFDVAVFPSLSEGLGVSAIEAMASGLPVIASAVGGLPEVVTDGETGLLVPPGDVEALASALRGLVEDPSERVRMGRHARKAAAEFDRDSMVRKTCEVYARVVKAGDGLVAHRP